VCESVIVKRMSIRQKGETNLTLIADENVGLRRQNQSRRSNAKKTTRGTGGEQKAGLIANVEKLRRPCPPNHLTAPPGRSVSKKKA